MALTRNGEIIDLHSFKDKPFGEFEKYVRKHIDPDYGTSKMCKPCTYEVAFKGTATVTQTVKVIALSEVEAQRLAREEIDCFGWEVDCDVDIDSEETEIFEID